MPFLYLFIFKFFGEMKVRHWSQNIIVKEKIAKIIFLMKDVQIVFAAAFKKIMHFRENNNLVFKCIAADITTFYFLLLF